MLLFAFLFMLLMPSGVFAQCQVCEQRVRDIAALAGQPLPISPSPQPPTPISSGLPAYLKTLSIDFASITGLGGTTESSNVQLGQGLNNDNKLFPHHNLACKRKEGVGGHQVQCFYAEVINAVGYFGHAVYDLSTEVQPIAQFYAKNRAPNSYMAAHYVEARAEQGINDQSSVIAQELTVANYVRDRGYQVNPPNMLSGLRLTSGNGADWGCAGGKCFPVDHALEIYPNGSQFYVGLFVGGGSTVMRDVLTISSAKTSIEVLGNHEVGLDLGGSFSLTPVKIRQFGSGGIRRVCVDNDGRLFAGSC